MQNNEAAVLYYVYQRDQFNGVIKLIHVFLSQDELFKAYSKAAGIFGWADRIQFIDFFGTDPMSKVVFGSLGEKRHYAWLVYADDVTLLRPETLLGWYREYQARRARQYSFRSSWSTGSKRKHCRYFRHPKTTQERRVMAGWLREEGEPAPRGARKVHQLPNAWDDIYRYKTKNWKAYRFQQWK